MLFQVPCIVLGFVGSILVGPFLYPQNHPTWLKPWIPTVRHDYILWGCAMTEGISEFLNCILHKERARTPENISPHSRIRQMS